MAGRFTRLAGIYVSYGNDPPAVIAADYETDLFTAASSARLMLGELLSHEQPSVPDLVYLLSGLGVFHHCRELARYIEAQEWS